jgi:sulfur relay (sulfurtransferase) DsrF/TusC family protein
MPKERIENYLLEMDLHYEELDDSLWIIYESDDIDAPKLIVSYSDEIVHFRMKMMDIPKNDSIHCELFRKLLEANATGLTHGAFAIEDQSIVLIDSLQSENLDFNEFQASVEALFLGVIENYDELSRYIEKEPVSK